MNLLDKAFYSLLNGKKTITSPIFMKEFTKENQQLKDLEDLTKKIISNKKKLIDKDIALLKYGIAWGTKCLL